MAFIILIIIDLLWPKGMEQLSLATAGTRRVKDVRIWKIDRRTRQTLAIILKTARANYEQVILKYYLTGNNYVRWE